MKNLKHLALTLIIGATTATAFAHGDEEHPEVEIHTFQNGELWENCSFQLHNSLTQTEFHRFTKEAGNIIYFQPLSAASSLGKFKFDFAISMNKTPIDQTSGAWNNTFAHPVSDLTTEDPHWLGDVIAIPNIRFRMGITDNIEIGTYITKDPAGNYGFFGGDLKYTYLVDAEKKINTAARISYSQLYGPKDLKFNTTSIDVLASKTWSVFEPYIGVSASLNHAKEKSDVVALTDENVITPRVLIGTRVHYKWAALSAEYDISTLNTFSFKVGVTF